MAEQYFTADPTCESKQVPCSFVYRGHGLNFMTDAGVFPRASWTPGHACCWMPCRMCTATCWIWAAAGAQLAWR